MLVWHAMVFFGGDHLQPTEEEGTNEQLWIADLHRVIAAQRGISYSELADESGLPLRTVERHMAGRPPGYIDDVDDALTRITERRGYELPQAIRVEGPLLFDGLPEVISLLDPEFQAYLAEMYTLDLMGAI
jgi:hypothetical protein